MILLVLLEYAPLAQLDRVTGYEPVGQGFESLTACQEKNPHLSTTNVGSFQLNPPCRVGEIIFDDEIPFGDEIRLNGGWVDLISSAKQISLKS